MLENTPPCDRVPLNIDIKLWVNAAKADPVLYRDRQVTEIILAAIGLNETLRTALVLKGGTLMALAFKSDRVTGDVDFTANVPPEGFAELLEDELNKTIPHVSARLGYTQLICRVQGIEKMPKPLNFETHNFPALLIRIGSAERGSPQHAALNKGTASRVLQLEVSFRDQVYAFQELTLIGAGVTIQAFALTEIIAEKYRALLQQPIRKRARRQDVYDIAYLLREHSFSVENCELIYTTLLEKCRTRDIPVTRYSISDPAVIDLARREWSTLQTEVTDLPRFDDCYVIVKKFYEELPWKEQ